MFVHILCVEKLSSGSPGYIFLDLKLNCVCFVFFLFFPMLWLSQLIEVTGKTQDECMVALHDCNEDVNRAINFLLESTSDTVSMLHPQNMCCACFLHMIWLLLFWERLNHDAKVEVQMHFVAPSWCSVQLSDLLGDCRKEAQPWERRRTFRDKGEQGEEGREGGQSWAWRVHQKGQRHQPRTWG